MGKLRDLPSTNMMHLLQALVMVPVMLWVTWALVRDRLPEMMNLPLMPVAVAAAATGQLIYAALRKASFALVLLGAVMLIRDRARYSQRLRMSKQEVKDEVKEAKKRARSRPEKVRDRSRALVIE